MKQPKPLPRTAIITARVQEKLLKQLDKEAKKYGMTRSAFIEMVLEARPT